MKDVSEISVYSISIIVRDTLQSMGLNYSSMNEIKF